MSAAPVHVDTLAQVPDRFLRSLASRLSQSGPKTAATGDAFVPFSPSRGIGVTLKMKTGGTVRARAYGTDLSPTGIRLIHGAFCHVGTSAIVDLPTRDGEMLSASGDVVHCKYLEARLYEIVVRWNHGIEMPLFTSPQDRPSELPQA